MTTANLRAENEALKTSMAAYDHAALAPSDTPAMRALRYDYDQLDADIQDMKRNRIPKQIVANELRLLEENVDLRRRLHAHGDGKWR